MAGLQEISRKILERGTHVVIGYAEGPGGQVRPFFAREVGQAGQLVYDERCRHNLAVYLHKKEVLRIGKPTVIANISTLRSVIRLAVEKQLSDGAFSVLAESEGQFTELVSLEETERFLNGRMQPTETEDRELMTRLNAMSREERWEFWQAEFEKCIRCYACRQVCPLCYCSTCTAESNQPQWIPVAPHRLGNTEWHLMRAMHLAGRCIGCGQCGAVCPMDIPIHMLTFHVSDTVREVYGVAAGLRLDEESAMSVYRPNDPENFIR